MIMAKMPHAMVFGPRSRRPRRAALAPLLACLLLVSLAGPASQAHTVPEAWTVGATAPAPTEGTQGAFIGGLFYHLDHGGFWSYDPVANVWAPQPSPSGSNHEGVGAAIQPTGGLIGGVLGALGLGSGGVFFSIGSAGVFVYDVATTTWTTAPSLMNPRDGLGAATVGGLVYAIGGKHCGGMNCGSGLSDVEVFDPATWTWSPGPALPVPVSDVYATAAYGTDIYVLGGFDGASVVNDVQVLDTTTMTWSPGPSMPTARSNAVAGVCSDHIYVAGGLDSSWSVISTVERLDLLTMAWGTAPPMPGPLAEMSAGLVGDGAGHIVATTGHGSPTMDDTYVFECGGSGLPPIPTPGKHIGCGPYGWWPPTGPMPVTVAVTGHLGESGGAVPSCAPGSPYGSFGNPFWSNADSCLGAPAGTAVLGAYCGPTIVGGSATCTLASSVSGGGFVAGLDVNGDGWIDTSTGDLSSETYFTGAPLIDVDFGGTAPPGRIIVFPVVPGGSSPGTATIGCN